MGGRCSGANARSMTSQAVVWFRRDLRLGDNPAWAAAASSADRVIALYVLDPILLAAAGPSRAPTPGPSPRPGPEPAGQGGRLLVLRGDPTEVVPQVAAPTPPPSTPTPMSRRTLAAVTSPSKRRSGPAFELWWGTLMHPPGSVTRTGPHLSGLHSLLQPSGANMARHHGPHRAGRNRRRARRGVPDSNTRHSRLAAKRPPWTTLPIRGEGDDYEHTRDRPDLIGTSLPVGRPAFRDAGTPHGRAR